MTEPLPEHSFVALLPEARAKSSACKACRRTKQKCDNTRPCGRCIRNGRADSCIMDDIDVERPISFKASILESDTGKVWPPKSLKQEWSFPPIFCFWSMGFRFQALAELFDSIPPRLRTSMIDMLKALDKAREVKPSPVDDQAVQDSAQAIRADQELPWEQSESQRKIEESMWGKNQKYGFFRLQYDLDTRQRRSVEMNSRHADILGIHREELLARFASFDADFQCPDLDTLRILLHRLNVIAQRHLGKPDSGELYFRMYSGSGASRRGVLIWCMAGKSFHQNFQIKKGTFVTHTISAEDYDEAVRRCPEHCPLYATGDKRTGQQLLDDIVQDSRASLSTIGESQAGARLLAELAVIVDSMRLQLGPDKPNGHPNEASDSRPHPEPHAGSPPDASNGAAHGDVDNILAGAARTNGH